MAATTKRSPKGAMPATDAFKAEIAEIYGRHHEAWINREPGDGLATDVVRDERGLPLIDPATGTTTPTRVPPRFDAFNGRGSAFPKPSKFLRGVTG